MRNGQALHIRDLPPGLRDMFHAACARRGLTMHEAVEEFMRKVVADDNAIQYLPTRLPRRANTRKDVTNEG
jgi:hypothetical protein